MSPCIPEVLLANVGELFDHVYLAAPIVLILPAIIYDPALMTGAMSGLDILQQNVAGHELLSIVVSNYAVMNTTTQPGP